LPPDVTDAPNSIPVCLSVRSFQTPPKRRTDGRTDSLSVRLLGGVWHFSHASHVKRICPTSLYTGWQWRHSVCNNTRRHVGGIPVAAI